MAVRAAASDISLSSQSLCVFVHDLVLAKAGSIKLSETLAVGDGANDFDMISAAGLGVAFHAKPKVAAAADASIRHADLTALLYAQGVTQESFAK